jgi:hypothetical protein
LAALGPGMGQWSVWERPAPMLVYMAAPLIPVLFTGAFRINGARRSLSGGGNEGCCTHHRSAFLLVSLLPSARKSASSRMRLRGVSGRAKVQVASSVNIDGPGAASSLLPVREEEGSRSLCAREMKLFGSPHAHTCLARGAPESGAPLLHGSGSANPTMLSRGAQNYCGAPRVRMY